jgi:hypothetical protein
MLLSDNYLRSYGTVCKLLLTCHFCALMLCRNHSTKLLAARQTRITPAISVSTPTHTHTYTHIYIYIYIFSNLEKMMVTQAT